MLYSIVHTTELSYTSRISESVIELRVAPRSDELQTLRGFGLAVGPAASVFEHVDWLGNRVHHFSIVDFHDRLVIEAQSAVEVRPRSLSLAAVPDELAALPDDHRLMDFRAFVGPVDRCDELGALAHDLGDRAGARGHTLLVGDLLAQRAHHPLEREPHLAGVLELQPPRQRAELVAAVDRSREGTKVLQPVVVRQRAELLGRRCQ